MLEGEYWRLSSKSGGGEVGVDKKKEVRLLTLPPCEDVYHAPYFTFLANT